MRQWEERSDSLTSRLIFQEDGDEKFESAFPRIQDRPARVY